MNTIALIVVSGRGDEVQPYPVTAAGLVEAMADVQNSPRHRSAYLYAIGTGPEITALASSLAGDFTLTNTR